MRATPNLNFTDVKPTDKSLKLFVTMLRSVYQNLVNVVNGNLGFGDGTLTDNVGGAWINVTAPVAPNTDFTVNHNLNRLPVGYWTMQKDRACDVYTGGVAATKTQLTLRATVASAVLRLFVVGVFICLCSPRSEAQGAVHRNFAAVAGSSGAMKAVSSALVTVCNGATLPQAGATCTGLANIFTNVGLTLTLANPFNADTRGNYEFFAGAGQNYVVSVGGAGVVTYSYVWVAPVVSGGTFSSLISATANPAQFGIIRLAHLDRIFWRNVANTADLDIELLAASGNIPADTFYFRGNTPGVDNGMEVAFVAEDGNQASVAASGFVRMHSADSIAWRNNANTVDILLSKTGAANGNIPADTFITGGGSGIAATFFSQGNTNDASSGLYRLPSTGAIEWRNTANSNDVGLTKTVADELQWGAGVGFRPGSTLFVNLGTPASGVLVYCSDCTIANPCAGGGTGAFAKRLNGIWVCN